MSFYTITGFILLACQVIILARLFIIKRKQGGSEAVDSLTRKLCIVIAILSLINIHAYAIELFLAYYSGAKYEFEAYKIRLFGHYFCIPWGYLLSSLLMALLLIKPLRSARKFIYLSCIMGLIFASALSDHLWTRLIIFFYNIAA